MWGHTNLWGEPNLTPAHRERKGLSYAQCCHAKGQAGRSRRAMGSGQGGMVMFFAGKPRALLPPLGARTSWHPQEVVGSCKAAWWLFCLLNFFFIREWGGDFTYRSFWHSPALLSQISDCLSAKYIHWSWCWGREKKRPFEVVFIWWMLWIMKIKDAAPASSCIFPGTLYLMGTDLL